MSTIHNLSEEELNAFVDNQLDPEERSRVFLAMREDPSVNEAVCELHKMRELVRHAYTDVPDPPVRAARNRRARLAGGMVAALLLLVVGGVSGWLFRGEGAMMPPSYHTWQDVEAFQTIQLAAAQGEPQRLILHIGTDDPIKLAYALDEVETLMSSSRDRGLPIQLEVVANGDGLSLLRTQTSPYPERTQQLMAAYDNLTIMACGNTLRWLQEQGVDVTLLPNISTTKSALERVMQRLQEGWLYIKV